MLTERGSPSGSLAAHVMFSRPTNFSAPDGAVTLYMGELYEVRRASPDEVTKYYYFGGQRVAMREPDDDVVWLHGDHLGSTSLTVDASGDEVARQLYYPFGGTRWESATALPTDFQFTGQRNDA